MNDRTILLEGTCASLDLFAFCLDYWLGGSDFSCSDGRMATCYLAGRIGLWIAAWLTDWENQIVACYLAYCLVESDG